MTNGFEQARTSMVARQLRARGIRDQRVLEAMLKVPRHEFVPDKFRSNAYEDNPIPVGEGQTISQPYIVAYMLEALQIAPTHRALEIGTGTGYQAALLGELANEVYTVERMPGLFNTAVQNLSRLGYINIQVVHGDGTQGMADHAPYDRIIVAAAAPGIPAPLFEQLAEGGRMVIPVGSPEVQDLLLVRKENGQQIITQLEGCRFVPLIGNEGFSRS